MNLFEMKSSGKWGGYPVYIRLTKALLATSLSTDTVRNWVNEHDLQQATEIKDGVIYFKRERDAIMFLFTIGADFESRQLFG